VRQDRRKFLIGLGAAPLASAAAMRIAAAQNPPTLGPVPDFPNPLNFESGDLLWPKRKGAIVPRTRGWGTRQGTAPAPAEQEIHAWEAARQQMLANPAASGLSREVAERLRTMSYEDFTRIYFTATTEEAPSSAPPQRSRGIGAQQAISVGHVGVIELAPSGTAYVIEATPTYPDGTAAGVIRTLYGEWLKRYTNVQVWHGRLHTLSAAARRRVVEVAASQLGKPYDFFNFDLSDDRGFYCSKLVWFCAWRGAQFAPDDNPDPRRGSRFPPWFAPKTLLNSKHIELLHNPGEY